MAHTLPDLPYDYAALEPYIDAPTMQIHHAKHHQTYIDKLNDALKDNADLAQRSLEELLGNLESIPEQIRTAIRNNGGGHWNHSFFWPLLAPTKSEPNVPTGSLKEAINTKFGDFETFKKEFTQSAIGRFGSGWAWLIKDTEELKIISTPNQDNPLMDSSGIPILALDVWEHAYYLKYQNRRAEYVEAFWHIVNWNQAEINFSKSGV